MNKSKRLVQLMMIVNEKKRFTVRELAEEFGVSYRTMLRDLQELEELGVPLYSEVGVHGGYRIVKDRVLPPIAFTEKEATAIFFINESLRYYGALPFQIEWETILRKFHHYLPKELQERVALLKERVVFWNPKRKQSQTILEDLLEGALTQRVLEICYQAEKGTEDRIIQPIGLYAYNGYWYCPAYCFKRKNFRLFRADRIVVVKEVDDVSINLSHVSLWDWLEEEPRMKTPDSLNLKVRLTEKGIRRFSSDLMFGDKIEILENGQGIIETIIDQNEISYCADLFFSIGPDAHVLEPFEVVEAIKDKINRISSLYEDGQ